MQHRLCCALPTQQMSGYQAHGLRLMHCSLRSSYRHEAQLLRACAGMFVGPGGCGNSDRPADRQRQIDTCKSLSAR